MAPPVNIKPVFLTFSGIPAMSHAAGLLPRSLWLLSQVGFTLSCSSNAKSIDRLETWIQSPYCPGRNLSFYCDITTLGSL